MAPDDDVHPLLDPRVDRPTEPAALQQLVHPLRIQLLGRLRREGPSTAAQLGTALRVSSALASYHLRQLESGGFVEDADAEEVADRRRGGRERWWRASARSTYVRTTTSDEDGDAIVRDYLGVVVETYARNARAWLDVEPEWPEEWQHLDDFSDVPLALTPAEARQLGREVGEVLSRYRRHEFGTRMPSGAAIVSFQYQLFPEASQSPPSSDA